MATKSKKQSDSGKVASLPHASLTISQLVRDARKKKGLSQQELGARLGYTNAQYISDWERARSPIPLNKLVAIAEILELDVDGLFELFVDFTVDRVKRGMKSEYLKLTAKKSKQR